MNDADLEMGEMEAAGAGMARVRKAGRCAHGSLSDRTCVDCGREFAGDNAWFNAINAAIEGICSECYGDNPQRNGLCAECPTPEVTRI